MYCKYVIILPYLEGYLSFQIQKKTFLVSIKIQLRIINSDLIFSEFIFLLQINHLGRIKILQQTQRE